MGEIAIHLGPDGSEYVTRQDAARAVGVSPHTITTWERRGRLERLPGTPSRTVLYRLADVIEAEYTARQNAARTSGVILLRRFDAA